MTDKDRQLDRIEQALYEGLRPLDVMLLDAWADMHLESPMYEGGRFSMARTPFAAEIARRLSLDDPTPLVVAMAGTQTFKTALGLAWLAYVIYYGLGPFMHVRPKIQGCKEFVRERIEPLWALKCLEGKVAPPRSRSAANTARYKEFNGGFFYAAGTHAADDLAAKTVRYYWQDETDREEPSAGGEGPAHQLVRKRTTRYGPRAKGLQTSSPTTEKGPIWQMWLGSSQADYEVPCPFCDHRQVLEWPHLHWAGDPRGPETEFRSWYDCPACHEPIAEWQKTEMLARGEWVHAYPTRPTKGYRLSSLYSPVGWRSWKALAADYAAATDAYRAGDPGPMQVFRNTDLAEPWEPAGEDEVPSNSLVGRREPWSEDRIPNGVQVITCGIDVQDDRLEAHVIGWGAQMERWTLHYRSIPGGPLPDQAGRYDWDILDDEVRSLTFTREDGRVLPIVLSCVDLAGHRTDDAYRYTRTRSPHSVVGIFGRYGDRPVVERQARRDQKRANALYRIVGTDPAKANLYTSLRTPNPGPNRWHFPTHTWCDADWFGQLTAEHAEKTVDKRKRVTVVWVKHRARNEVLDTAVYAYAAYRILEIEGRLRRLMADPASTSRRAPPPVPALQSPETRSEGRSTGDDRDEDAADQAGPGPVRPDYFRGRYGGRDPRRD